MDLSFKHLVHVVLVLGLAAQTTSGYWVLGCGKPVAVERLDPIVSPKMVSSHVHSIMGGSSFDWEMDFGKTQTSNCTTCGVSKDLSNYWVPTVYFHAENGSYISVEQVGGVNVYYQQREDHTEVEAGKKIQPFPPGLRMLAGDPARRTYNFNISDNRAIEFDCIPAHNDIGANSTGGFPVYNGTRATLCQGGLQIRVRFPSCWDGVNDDSKDHRSHVSYPSMMDNGVCDDAHPVRIMALLYETTWAVDRFEEFRKVGDQPFVVSTGDPTGYGWHADFLNGWDTEVLRAAINDDATCGNNASGVIDHCGPLKPYLLTADQQNACPAIEPTRIREQVDGVLSHLPGISTVEPTPSSFFSTIVVEIPAPTATANAARRRVARVW